MDLRASRIVVRTIAEPPLASFLRGAIRDAGGCGAPCWRVVG